MSMQLFTLRKEREEALAKADSIVRLAETANRAPSASENYAIEIAMKEVAVKNSQIKSLEANNSILTAFPGGRVIVDAHGGASHLFKKTEKPLTSEYLGDFYKLVQSGGKEIGAALYEGSNGAGGYAVPIVVNDQIVPLAPQEMAVRRLAMVIPTSSDIKFPVKASFGAATAKAETSSFTENEPTLSQFTLSAFMAGTLQEISWELAQDVPAFQSFAVDDMLLDQQVYEENLYVNGTGSGQAQGLIGNCGAGGTYEPDTNGNTVSIAGILSLIATLNAVYHPGASFLCTRATSIIIRTAQMQSNLFYPAFTTDANGQDRLFGYPIQYSQSMPSAIRGHAPLLFGDFKRGYIIGDRGGSGINVKVLDQPLATQGLIQLLAYRRTDGRVRRSEAIQQYNISAS